MTQDELIFSLLKGLVSNRVYPDIAPQDAATPYVTHQDVGGDAVNFMDGAAPGKSNTRLQVNVWAQTRAQAKAIAQRAATPPRAAKLPKTQRPRRKLRAQRPPSFSTKTPRARLRIQLWPSSVTCVPHPASGTSSTPTRVTKTV